MSGKASLVRLPEQCHEGSIMVPYKGSRRVSGVGFGMLRMFLGVGIPVCWGGAGLGFNFYCSMALIRFEV